MGVVSKTGIRFSAILYAGIALGYVNTVVIFPNILSQEVFGLTRILFAAASLIAQLSHLGVGNIMVRFHPYLKGGKKNTTLTLGILISLFGVLLSAGSILLFKEQIMAYYSERSALFNDYFYLLVPIIISLVIYNLFDGYLRVLYKNSFSPFLNSVLLRVIFLVVVLSYGSGLMDTTAFIHTYVGGQMAVTLAVLGYALSTGHITLGLGLNKDQITTLKSMSQFGLITVLSGLSFLLINRIDMILLGGYVGLAEVGIYSIALYMSMVIVVPAQSIGRTSGVLVANAFKTDDRLLIKTLYQKTALHQMLFGTIIFVLILVNYDSLMSFLPETYRDSLTVFLFLGIAKIVDIGFGVNGAILLNSRYYKVDTMLSVSLLALSVLLKVYFIPAYGIAGAAASTALALVLFNLAKYLFLHLKLNLTPFTRHYFLTLAIVLLPLFPIFIFPSFHNFLIDIPLRSTVYLVIVVPSVYYFNVSPEFNAIIRKAVSFKR